MRVDADPARALSALPTRATQAATQFLDLSRPRQLVHGGGEGDVLAVFLDSWREFVGVWIGPADAQDAARLALRQRELDDRVHCVAGDALDAIPAGDLVVLSAVDAAVDVSLRLLVSAGPGWLPADGRWLILQRESPHLSSVVGGPLLHGQGLRVASRWPLATGVQMLVCAPAQRFSEVLVHCSDRSVGWSAPQ